MSPARRDVLRGLSAASLLVGLDARAAVRSSAEAVRFSPFIEIAPDGAITFRLGQAEMGQGITTGLAMLLAEELDADWTRVTVAFATGPEFRHPIAYAQPPLKGEQITGGSLSTTAFAPKLRAAGAAARAILKQAAATRWGCAPGDLATGDSVVRHPARGLAAGYGELVAEARRLPAPPDPPLKPRAAWTRIGRPTQRLDTPAKVRGSATYGIDAQVPGLLHGAVRHAPVMGSRALQVGADAARRLPGVRAVVPYDDPGQQSGVVVVADSYWRAQQAVDALEVRWSPTARDGLDTAAIEAELAARLEGGPAVAFATSGDPQAVLAGAARTLQADHHAPYLAHACMEPMNATAWVRDGRCDLWVGTQRPDHERAEVARVLGIAPEAVEVHMAYLGGGFGRRGSADYSVVAALASRAAGAPVKVIWSRQEDLRHDHFRPAMAVRQRAALGPDGNLLAWTTRVAGPGIWRQSRPALVADGIDYMAVEGLGESYPVAHQSIAWAETEPHARIGFWRGVGASHNVAFTEAFVDELAEAAGADPIAWRLGLLAADPRGQAVLRRVSAMCGWQGPRTARGGRGVAYYQSKRWQTRVAQVVEVERADGLLRPTRVWCAVDSGVIVNPAQAEAQLQGATLFGLSAGLWGEVAFEGGTPQSSSFADYRVLQLGDAPPVEVSFIEGGEGFGSIGEIGAPAAPAALLNAAWAATGRRIRRLPLARSGLA